MPTGQRHFEVLDKSPILLSRVRVTRVSLTMRVACVAGARKWWAKERTGVREGDTRVSFSCARFFLCPLLPSACNAGYYAWFWGTEGQWKITYSQTPSYEIPHYHIIALSLVKQNPYIFYLFKFIHLFINLFTSFSGHRPAQRERDRTELRSYARCHPYLIPQPVKVGHTTGV